MDEHGVTRYTSENNKNGDANKGNEISEDSQCSGSIPLAESNSHEGKDHKDDNSDCHFLSLTAQIARQ